MKRKLYSLAAIILVSTFAKAQTTFTEATSILENTTLSGGVAMAVVDMNNDRLDDIIRLDNGINLQIEYQQPDGSYDRLQVGNVGSPWGISIADVDENGFNDIIVGGSYDGLRLLTANEDGTDFSLTTLGGPNIFVQNTNFADINNDGAIDYFACHDDGISSPYENDGNGSFTYNLDMINAVSAGESDNSGNYGSIWTDYDNDGDIDLFISKCRLQAQGDPTDPRRLNVLYQNDGSNNFTEVAEDAGLRPMTQTWATNFEDIDNDGDFDAVMVNHFVRSQIFENNGDGTFTDITLDSGVTANLDALGLGIQVMMEDYDNDTFIDIILTTRDGTHQLLLNDGDQTFTAVTNPFPNSNDQIQSAAVGDLNNDGFIDLIAGYANGFNNPSGISDQVFMNNGNDNNWIKIALEGVESNSNGIGARVEIQGPWGSQVREVRAGESYGTQNSLITHFGLGAADEIETITVTWPSGIVDTAENVDGNLTVIIREGEGLLGLNDITTSSEISGVFPNPATTQINITTTPNVQANTIYVYDLLGRQVIVQNIQTAGTQAINISSLTSGVYFVSIGDSVQKFIKK
ncbi:FG-GAP-like repeat-containing protein [uncultured Dokdonia sp.]|uniref:FG-GAP-like repeat-containing protein n=1 Tax=uncultured Dokdonia sp. TaxID=575653 RepID=UPI00261CA3C3|nr:FG-GAP-like repeat-containing protein [uncultured Dokdonia sp.]